MTTPTPGSRKGAAPTGAGRWTWMLAYSQWVPAARGAQLKQNPSRAASPGVASCHSHRSTAGHSTASGHRLSGANAAASAAPAASASPARSAADRSEEHTSELQSRSDLVCRLLLEKKKNKQ